MPQQVVQRWPGMAMATAHPQDGRPVRDEKNQCQAIAVEFARCQQAALLAAQPGLLAVLVEQGGGAVYMLPARLAMVMAMGVSGLAMVMGVMVARLACQAPACHPLARAWVSVSVSVSVGLAVELLWQ